MPDYPLRFPIEAGSPSPLNNIAKAAEQIAQQTKLGAGSLNLFNQTLKQGEASGLSFSNNLKETLTQFGKMGGAARAFSTELRDVIKQQERLRKENEASGRSFQQLGQQIGRSGILSVLGGSGLGRGAYPLSSAITGAVGGGAAAGIGAAILGAGSIVAAAAALKSLADRSGEYGREQENLATKTGLSVTETQLFSRAAQIAGTNIEGLVRSVRTLSQSMAENGAEGKKQKEALAELGLNQSVLAQPPAAALNQIYSRISQLSDPFARERITSNLFGRGGLEQLPLVGQLKTLEDQLRSAGAIMDEQGIHKAAEYKRQMELLGIEWDVLKQKFGQKVIGSIEILVNGRSGAGGGINLTDLLLAPFLGGRATEGFSNITSSVGALFGGGYGSFDKARGLEMYNSRPELKGQVPDPISLFRQQRQDQIESILDAPGPNEKGDLEARLRKAQEKVTVEADKVASNILGSLDPLRNARAAVDVLKRQIATLATEKELQSYIDSIAKKTATIAVPLYDTSTGKPLIDQKTGRPQTIASESRVMDIYAGRDEEVKRLGLNKEQASRATGAANIAAGRELTLEQDEATRARMERELYTHNRFAKESPDNAIRATAIVAGMPEDSALKLTTRDVDEGLKRNAENLARNAKDANSMQAAIRTIQEESAKHAVETDTRLQTSLATSGMTGVQKITTEGALDIQGAARSRDAQIAALGPAVDKLKPLVDYTADDFKKMESSAKIIADFKEKERDIAAQTVAKLDEERQRAGDQHASTFASGIMAAATHSGEAFGRSLGRSIGQTMLENFGKNFIFQKGGPFEAVQGTLGGSSTLGKLFQGTGLFNIKGDANPLTAPAVKLDTAGDKLITAANVLGRRPGAAPTGTGSGFAVGVPGLTSFGSGTPASAAIPPAARSIFSSIKNIFSGTQKYAGPGINGGGIEPVIPGTPGAGANSKPLTEQITSLLGGSNGEGLSGRGGPEGIVGSPATVDTTAIEADVQAIQAQTAATTDLTAAVQAQTQATEYIYSGGAAGEMPGGVTVTPSPAVTGSAAAAIPGLATFGSDITGLTGGANASGALGAVGAAIPVIGALATGFTAFSKATGIGQQGLGEHAGVAGGGGNNGNGAGITIAPAPTNVPGAGNITSGDNLGVGPSGLPSDSTLYGTVSSSGKIASSITAVKKGIGNFAGLMANPFAVRGDDTFGATDTQSAQTGSASFSPLGVAAAGADVALGAMTAVSQFQKGGARGALGGTSAILGTAAALDPEPISKAVLGIAALGTSLIKDMLGDPKVQRQKQISKNLFLDQYQAPEAQNVTSSTMGTYADIGANGNIRTSSLSPYARTTTPYLDLPYRFNVPGTQSSQFGGGGPITINANISAMDSGSFETFLKKNPNALMEGFSHGLTFGASRATQAIKGVIGQS